MYKECDITKNPGNCWHLKIAAQKSHSEDSDMKFVMQFVSIYIIKEGVVYIFESAVKDSFLQGELHFDPNKNPEDGPFILHKNTTLIKSSKNWGTDNLLLETEDPTEITETKTSKFSSKFTLFKASQFNNFEVKVN